MDDGLPVLHAVSVEDPADVLRRAASVRSDLAARLDAALASLDGAGVDALVVGALANIRYLTGFTGSAGTVVVRPEGVTLLTDGRYRTQAAEQLAGHGLGDRVDVVIGGAAEQQRALGQLVAGPSSRRVGVEADHTSWAAARRLMDVVAPAELVPTTGVIERLRQVKDEGELAAMAAAAAVADAALAEVVGLVAPGRRELEVAAALDAAMRRLGAEDRAFETIVASGPNAAKPHARPGDRAIERGDVVVVDFGAVVAGYRSDMTRTFAAGGQPSPELRAVHRLVGDSQRRGVAAVAPGVTTGTVDAACREPITAAGYGPAFEHGTGHGVGLDIHEAPAVSAAATAILAPGIVVTVEPGVYLAGAGGVRIEDTVVVTDDGCRPLTRFPKEPVLPEM
jgi:Xaa-Pro aminopeptidase